MKELNLLILETCFLQKDLDQICDEQDVPEQDKAAEETVLKFKPTKSILSTSVLMGRM